VGFGAGVAAARSKRGVVTPEEWQSVKDLFAGARELPPSERPAFLESACAGEPERRRQVESLLASSDERWSLLDGLPAAALASAILPAEDDARIGRRIGAYKVVSEIGQGGMGAVYLARRADGQFEQTVALKLVKRGMDTDAVLARFRQEREILARLHHPNIAQLYDGGATEDGRPFFAMEHVEGEPLLEYCGRRQMSVPDRLRLFRTVCSAAHYAHRNLIVHRDIKPSNILVTPDGVPKLLDFGIAKIQEASVADRTATGLRAMTPDYASPEQVRGEPITTATDVYSLGVVLYELLAARRPYRVKAGEPAEIARAVCEQEPERPSAIVRELAGDVENIILMAMRKEPERRYASAEQLAEDIRLCLDGRPILARSDTLGYRTAKFVRRNRLLVTAVTLVFLSLVGGIGVSLRQAAIARSERAKAQRRFNDLRKLANSFLFEFQDSIKDLAGSTPARELLVRRGLEYLDSLASEAGGDPQVMRDLAQGYQKLGQLQGDLGTGSAALGDMEASVVSYRKAQAILETLVRTAGGATQDRLALADLYSSMSDPIARGGDTTMAIDLARKAVAIAEAVVTAEPSKSSTWHRLSFYNSGLGVALKFAGRRREALEAFRKSATLIEKASAARPDDVRARRSVAIAHIKVADTLDEIGNFEGALEEYRRGLTIETELAARDPANGQLRRDLSFFYENMAHALGKSGNGVGAVQSSRKAVQIRRELAAADPKNPSPRLWLAAGCEQLGKTLVSLGEVRSAMRSLREALGLLESVLAASPGDAIALEVVAETEADMGDAHRREFSRDGRIERLRDARSWFEKSRETYADLQSQGRLPANYARDVDEVTKKLAACDAKLEKLGAGRPKPAR